MQPGGSTVTTQKERKEKKRKLVKEPKQTCGNILCLQKPASFQSSGGKKNEKKNNAENTSMFLKRRREENGGAEGMKEQTVGVEVCVLFKVEVTDLGAGEHTVSQSIPAAVLPHPRACAMT